MWTKEESKRWKQLHASTCIDCGNLTSNPGITRCWACYIIHRRQNPAPQSCPNCGKPMNQSREYKTKTWAAKTCKSCATKQRWESGKMEHTSWYKGEKTYNWKGGRFKNSGGYILIYKPNHPRARRNYVLEHILIWEQANRKPLPDGWIIHHLNGIKDDNRPKNLVGLPGRQHYLVLAAKAKRIQELEALLNGQHQLL